MTARVADKTVELTAAVTADFTWNPDEGLTEVTLHDSSGGQLTLTGDDVLRMSSLTATMISLAQAHTQTRRADLLRPDTLGLVETHTPHGKGFIAPDANLEDFATPYVVFQTAVSAWHVHLAGAPSAGVRHSAAWNDAEAMNRLVELVSADGALAAEAALTFPEQIANDRSVWQRNRNLRTVRTVLAGVRVNIAGTRRALHAAGADTRSSSRYSRMVIAPLHISTDGTTRAPALVISEPRWGNNNVDNFAIITTAMAEMGYHLAVRLPEHASKLSIWTPLPTELVAPYADALAHRADVTASGRSWGTLV